MDLTLVVRGVVLGLAISAPVGPIGVLCIRRTLSEGRVVGLVSGLGAATADALYGALVAFGLTAVTSLLVGGTFWLQLIGGLFLLYLGVQTMRARPAELPAEASGRGLIGAYLSTLVLTIANPLTVLSFVGIFAGLGIGTSGYSGALLLVLGVFLGSATWWLLLSGGVSLLRARITPAVLVWVNRISGALIIVAGLVALGGLSA